uniref:Zgc:158258 n=1 Tax=Echeneis naucrates TaxID=173247 RepID=A0A665XE77_ECHNA
MPKSDTWPGGFGLEAMTGMDSAGSCDSVVSANSGFSDDSLEYLSAEEKACLMFLEETIESLDTEEDSGLSNDEPDQLPSSGNLATKQADLSASISKSKLSGDESSDNCMLSYLVPTPLVMASSSLSKPGLPPDKKLCSMPQVTSSSSKYGYKHNEKLPPVPSENSRTNPRDYPVRTTDGPLPRGPLSYEALVHLRRSASTKKTPLSERSHSELSKSKTSPPVVAPKPKNIPPSIPVKTPSEALIMSDSSCNVKHVMDPQVVRLEALQKLGLLKDQQPENETVAPLLPPKPLSVLDPTSNRFTKAPSNCNPSRSTSFCYSQVPIEPKNKSLHSSASFHHYPRRDQQSASVSHPAKSSGLKAAGLEPSATLDSCSNGGTELETTTEAQPVSNKHSHTVPYTVMVVPGMGGDRKEALRKLGLLKD